MAKSNRVIGGADSIFVVASLNVLKTVLAETKPQYPQLLDVAKEELRKNVGALIDVTKGNVSRHLDKMLNSLEELRDQHESEEDILALLQSNIDEINLDDENLFPRTEEEQFLSEKGHQLVHKYANSGSTFVLERIDFKESAYLAIGTNSGAHPKFPGQDFNVFCTTNGLRTIRDAGEDLVVFYDGKQLTKSADKDGRSYFIRFVPLGSRRTWRFWVNTTKNGVRRDINGLKFTIKLNPDNSKGYDVTQIKRAPK